MGDILLVIYMVVIICLLMVLARITVGVVVQ